MIRRDELEALMFERQAAMERTARLYTRLHADPVERFEASRSGDRWLSWLSGLAGASGAFPAPAPSSNRGASAE